MPAGSTIAGRPVVELIELSRGPSSEVPTAAPPSALTGYTRASTPDAIHQLDETFADAALALEPREVFAIGVERADLHRFLESQSPACRPSGTCRSRLTRPASSRDSTARASSRYASNAVRNSKLLTRRFGISANRSSPVREAVGDAGAPIAEQRDLAIDDRVAGRELSTLRGRDRAARQCRARLNRSDRGIPNTALDRPCPGCRRSRDRPRRSRAGRSAAAPHPPRTWRGHPRDPA